MEKNKLLIFAIATSLITVIVAYIWLIKSSKDILEPVLVIVALLLTVVSSLISSTILKRKEKKIFIVYSHQDKHEVMAIYDALKKANFKAIIDEDIIHFGDNINDKIKATIKDVNTLMIVISKSSINSDWTKKELEVSLKENKEIIPVLINEVEIPELIRHLKYADLREFNSIEVDKLISNLKKKYSAQQRL